MEMLLIVLVAAYLLFAPMVGVVAFFGSQDARRQIGGLERRLHSLERSVERLARALDSPRDGSAAPRPTEPAPPAPVVGPAAMRPVETAAQTAPTAPSRATPDPFPGRGLEESLASRWLVWLGGGTLAIAGVFLVQYSAERGWLVPAVRCLLGFILGGALIAAGEWFRRQAPQRTIAAIRPDYVPPALSAAGLFTAFASVYAAHALYDLLGPALAFASLAVLAVSGVALSILQGPLIALLGVLGGFATPFLVTSQEPSPWPLFGYLLVLVAGAVTVVRYTAWWWLAGATLAGAGLWALVGMLHFARDVGSLAVALFLVLLTGLFLFVPRGGRRATQVVTWATWFGPLEAPERVAWTAAGLIACLVFVLVRLNGYDGVSLGTVATLGILYLLTGRREPAFDGLGAIAAILVAALFATWHLPEIVTAKAPAFVIEGQGYGTAYRAPIIPPELLPFAAAGTLFAALFAGLGFLLLWGARRPALWSAVAAATPISLLAIAYWRFAPFEADISWMLIALGLGGLALAAAARVEQHRALPGMTGSLAAFAAAVVACISLGAVMVLEQAWLTVALALQLPALAWIAERLGLRSLRPIALVLAAVVLVRLVLNVQIVDYPRGDVLGASWVLYGYGLPTVAFFLAARRFRATADDVLVTVLDAGVLVFAVLLVTFEIHVLVEGSLGSPRYRLFEASLHTIAWLAIGYGLLRRDRASPRRVVVSWGWRVLLGLAAGQIALVHLILLNPLRSGDPVGELPILNDLALAYALPAGFALLIVPELRRRGPGWAGHLAGLFGFALGFAYLSLELRRFFQGPVLSTGGTSDAEWYGYSVVWLAYAAGLLTVAIRLERSTLRYASLAVLLATVAKVFLLDTAALTGFWRVASFLGLGLSLVAVSYVYQRFVFGARASPS